MERRHFFGSFGGALGGLCLGRSIPDAGRFPSASAFREVVTGIQYDESFWRLVRGQFLFPSDYVYLNTGGLGASPFMVINTVKEKSDLEDTYPSAGHNLDDWHQIKARCAGLFGQSCRQQEIALISTATEGINIVLNGLPLKRGDEIITSTHEHPALNIPLLNKMKTEGVMVRTFEPDLEKGTGNIERIRSLISPRTRLIFISHVTCTTGQIFPVIDIGRLARERGIWYALDGAQAVAALPMDIGEIDVDFYAVSCHKWMLGPKRTGILYVRESRLDLLKPTVIGAYSDRGHDLQRGSLEFQATAQRYEYGTENDALYYGLGEAADFISAIGLDAIWNRNRSMAEQFVSGLHKIPAAEILSPLDQESRSSMITFRLKNIDYREVSASLSRKRYRVRPVGEVGLNATRISFHIHNNEREVEQLLDDIGEITGRQS